MYVYYYIIYIQVGLCLICQVRKDTRVRTRKLTSKDQSTRRSTFAGNYRVRTRGSLALDRLTLSTANKYHRFAYFIEAEKQRSHTNEMVCNMG